jgi:general secretion pathway protein I
MRLSQPPSPTADGRATGFTLIEVLLAIVILTTGLVLVFEGFSVGLRAASIADKETTATLVAQRLIADLETQEALSVGTEEGEYEEDYPGYRWRLEIQESADGISGLYEVQMTVTWTQGDREREITVTRLIAQTY